MNDYYAVMNPTDHLAHYGIKGMKWGVRKALIQGNQRALDRHYRKAAKKLKKLQDMGLHSGKYAAKSAAYGAAAAGVGTLAVGGTSLPAALLSKYVNAGPHTKARYNTYLKLRKPAEDLKNFGEKAYANKKVTSFIENAGGEKELIPGTKIYKTKTEYVPTITGDTLYRAGTGLAALGLAAKSAQNAYRASHGDKYRRKAVEFKTAMDDAFKGTKYAGQYIVPKRKYGIRRKKK